MNQKLLLTKSSPLNGLIKEIEDSGRTVQIFRDQKVVAKIVPNTDEIYEEQVNSGQYKTWGETLQSGSVRI